MIRKIRTFLKRIKRATAEPSPEQAEVLATIKFPCC